MSQPLDKNHPFRSSVDYSSPESSPLPESSSPEPKSSTSSLREKLANPEIPQASKDEQKESFISSSFRAFLKLSPKIRVLSLAIGGGLICYSYILIYDAIFGVAPPSQHVEPMVSSFEDYDRDYTAKKPSWVQRTFCKGVKRTFLCD